MTPILLALLLACGKERWSVKVMTDDATPDVNVPFPESATVAKLASFPPPPYDDNRARTVYEELNAFEVDAWVLGFKKEADEDFHVVIADTPTATIVNDARPGHGSLTTMVVEFPSPDCTQGSPYATDMEEARQAFLKLVGAAPKSGRFRLLSKPVHVRLRGVGFFDKDHGQKGRARNVLELHPVLYVEAL